MNNTGSKISILEKIGITPEMQTVFETLLDIGFCTAGKMSLRTGFKRSYVYKLLDLLEEKNLIKKDKQKNKVTYYYPQNPKTLNELIDKQKEKIQEEEILLQNNLSRMLTKFNILEGKPNVSFFEGTKGLINLHEDILLEKKDIKLIRSVIDSRNPQTEKIINKYREKEREIGIKTKVIGPMGISKEKMTKEELIKNDSKYLVERRIFSRETFSNEAQIIIYANKVAITSYDEHIITTIIESLPIKKTFESIFETMWAKGEKPY